MMVSEDAKKRALSSDTEDINNTGKKLHASVLEVELENEEVFKESEVELETVNIPMPKDPEIPTDATPSTQDILKVVLEESKDEKDPSTPTMGPPNSTQEVLKDLLEDSNNEKKEDHTSSKEESINLTCVSVPSNILENILTQLQDMKNDNVFLKEKLLTVEAKLSDMKTEMTNKTTCKCKGPIPSNSTSNSNTSENRSFSSVTTTNLTPDLNTLKQTVIPNWGRRFNYRRKQFKNMDKNYKRAEIYQNFLSSESGLYIVKRSRPKFASDLKDYKLAEQLSIQEMKVQAERWSGYAENSKKNVASVDQQVKDLISSHPVEEQRETLKKQWEKEVTQSENKAMEMNTNELEFMVNMPESDPYEGYVESVGNQRFNNRGFYKRDFYRSRQDSRGHHSQNYGTGNPTNYNRPSNRFNQNNNHNNRHQMDIDEGNF